MGSFDSEFWNELDEHWEEGEGEEAEKSEYSLLPEGDFDVTVAKWHFMESEKKKTPGMNIEFNVITNGYTNRKLWHTFWLTPNNLPYVFRDVRIMTGQRLSKPSDLQDVNFDNISVRVSTKHEDYNDKTKSVITSFKPIEVKPVGESSGGGEPAF